MRQQDAHVHDGCRERDSGILAPSLHFAAEPLRERLA